MTRSSGFWLITLTILMPASALAQGSSITYQGKLADSGTSANGQYDFQFKLFDTATVGTGSQQGGTVTVSSVTVSAGIFTVQLDFGVCPTCFNGAARFLEIAVKPTSGSTFTTLDPRQPIASTPYAIKSLNAAAADGLSVACINCVTSSQIGSVSGSVVSGAIPVASVPAGSGSYIQNGTSAQASSNFNISGNGTAAGTLSGNIVNAATQFNLGSSRVLSNPGFQNFFVGADVGLNNTGSQNSFFGYNAGLGNTSGGSNAFFGATAGQNNTTGSSNSFFGAIAGGANSTGTQNAFFGTQTGFLNTTGGSNSFFGTFAGRNNSTASANTFIGANADFNTSNPTGNFNTLVGYGSQVISGVTNGIAIGARAQVTASNSLVLGAINGVNGSGADTNVGIGTTAPTQKLHVVGNALFTGNVTISGVLTANLPANSANYIQNGTSQQLTSNFNISGNGTAGGTLSANAINATTQYNLGTDRVLFTSASGTNLLVGVGTGGSTTGSFNTFVGTSAGGNTTISGANSFFGYQAGLANINGGANAFFGYQAGVNNSSGGNNEFFGFQAGSGNTSGGGNAFFGQQAGASNTTGIRNTLIGNQADVSANNLNNATAIGSQAQVSQSNSVVLGAINGINGATADTNVGIGTTAPSFKLQVIDPSNTGLRVQTNGTGGTVASFGGSGDFQIDATGVAGGRLIVKQAGSVGIGTNNPQSKLHVQGETRVTGGNIFIAQPNSLIITSPNGSCWQIRVSDAGALSAASVTCP
jgi:hypothetical protein